MEYICSKLKSEMSTVCHWTQEKFTDDLSADRLLQRKKDPPPPPWSITSILNLLPQEFWVLLWIKMLSEEYLLCQTDKAAEVCQLLKRGKRARNTGHYLFLKVSKKCGDEEWAICQSLWLSTLTGLQVLCDLGFNSFLRICYPVPPVSYPQLNTFQSAQSAQPQANLAPKWQENMDALCIRNLCSLPPV